MCIYLYLFRPNISSANLKIVDERLTNVLNISGLLRIRSLNQVETLLYIRDNRKLFRINVITERLRTAGLAVLLG